MLVSRGGRGGFLYSSGSAGGGGLDLTSGGTIGGNLVVSGTLNVTGAVDLDSTLLVNGAADFDSTLLVNGAADFDSTVNIDGDATVRQLGTPMTAQNLTAAGDTIAPTTGFVGLSNGSGGVLTLTSTPTIATTGVPDGMILTLQHVGASNSITIQDIGTLAGSKLNLGSAANKTITVGDSIVLQYNAADDQWVQISTLQALT